MSRFTVMGFTEAELGFVLAGLFAALAGARVIANRQVSEKMQIAEASLKHQVDSLKSMLDSTKSILAKNADKGRGMESNMTARCWERGLPRDPVGTLIVVGPDSYALGSSVLTVDGVRQAFHAALAKGAEFKCKQYMNVIVGEDVSGAVYRGAAARLRGLFYVLEP